jgi:hypothetical protein
MAPKNCYACGRTADVWLRAHFDGIIWIVFCCFAHRQGTDRLMRQLRFAGSPPDFISEHNARELVQVPLALDVDSP